LITTDSDFTVNGFQYNPKYFLKVVLIRRLCVYFDTLTSIISIWISTMVKIIKHVAVHSGLHQSKLIHGSHHTLWY